MLKLALSLSGVALVGVCFVVSQFPAFMGRQFLVLTEALFEIRSVANVDGWTFRILQDVHVEHSLIA